MVFHPLNLFQITEVKANLSSLVSCARAKKTVSFEAIEAGNMTKDLQWFVVYTKPRWEKKVALVLEEKGVDVYCPINRVIRQWSDRKKTVLEPLFKGYVFVHITEDEKTSVLQTNGVLNFVYWNRKPAVVRDEEIETIKRFLSEFSDVDVEDLELEVNQQVVIRNGLLINYHGIVLEILGNKAKVLVESMGLRLSATIDRKNLQAVLG